MSAGKVKTLKVSYPNMSRDPNMDPRLPENKDKVQVYRVISITDSVRYAPGQDLLKSEVEELCEHKSWKVTVVAPN